MNPNESTTKGRRKSDVWEYFDSCGEGFALCKNCKAKISNKSGQTTTMRRHLKICKGYNMELSSSFCSKLLKWFIKRNISFKSIEDEELKEAINMINPTVQLVGETTFRQSVLDEVYKKSCLEIEDQLKTIVSPISITTDIATIMANPFITITVHGCDENFENVNVTVACDSFNVAHSKSNIKEYVKTKIDELKLDNKLFGIVADGCYSNLGLNDLCELRITCIVHSCNLLMGSIISSSTLIQNLLKKLNQIVKDSHVSMRIKNKLQSECKVKNVKFCSLQGYCKTRFNSCYKCFDSFFRMKSVMNSIENDYKLTEIEWKIIKSLLPFAKQLNVIYNKLASTKDSTSPFVIPLIKEIENQLGETTNLMEIENDENGLDNNDEEIETLSDAAEDFSCVEAINDEREFVENEWKRVALRKFNEKLSYVYSNTHFLISSFLFPPTRVLLSVSELDLAYGKLKEEVEKSKTDNQTNSPESIIDNFVKLEFNGNSVKKFWQQINTGENMELVEIAKRHLFVPSRSIESERVFSMLGNTFTEQRNRLDPERVESMMKIKASFLN